MKTAVAVLRHGDTNCLSIGNTDEGKTQRKIEGLTKSTISVVEVQKGMLEDGPLGGGRLSYSV